MTTQAQRPWMTLADIAAELGVSLRTVRRRVLKDGEMPHMKFGSRVLVRRTAFEDYCARCETTPKVGTPDGCNPEF